jgi:hypothetical protein
MTVRVDKTRPREVKRKLTGILSVDEERYTCFQSNQKKI